MENQEPIREQNGPNRRAVPNEEPERDLVTPGACLVGAGLWWFLSPPPSGVALIVAALLLGYCCLGFCYLALTLPGPEDQPEKERSTAVPRAEAERRKVSTA